MGENRQQLLHVSYLYSLLRILLSTFSWWGSQSPERLTPLSEFAQLLRGSPGVCPTSKPTSLWDCSIWISGQSINLLYYKKGKTSLPYQRQGHDYVFYQMIYRLFIASPVSAGSGPGLSCCCLAQALSNLSLPSDTYAPTSIQGHCKGYFVLFDKNCSFFLFIFELLMQLPNSKFKESKSRCTGNPLLQPPTFLPRCNHCHC